MRENQKFKIKVKNGFYVGDLCYSLSDKVYREVWGGAGYKDGSYVDPQTGLPFAMVSTSYGDGEYPSDQGFYFCVDAGIIGIADLELCTEPDIDAGITIPNFRGYVTIEYNNGIIIVTARKFRIEIDTR